MIYANFSCCQRRLAGIEAIDYFFAKQMMESLKAADNEVLLHVFIALHWAQRQGHSCLPVDQISGKCLWKGLDDNEGQVGFQFPELSAILALLEDLALSDRAQQGVVFDGLRLYLRRMWLFEQEIALKLSARLDLQPLNAEQQARLICLMPQLFPSPPQGETDWQQVAVVNSLNRGFSLISGGPGTGKTYSVSRLLAAFLSLRSSKAKILMAAPTGKAAQRLSESILQAKLQMQAAGIAEQLIEGIPEQASTLHRLLGFRPQHLGLKFDAEHPLDCDLLLLDEASMIDLAMMARLLRALPEKANLVLLGDVDQLPSVEAGSLLTELACKPHPGFNAQSSEQILALSRQQVSVDESTKFNHLSLLTKSHRFGGDIGAIAQDVIVGKVKSSWQRLQANANKGEPFTFQAGRALQLLDPSIFAKQLAALTDFYYSPISRCANLLQAFSALNRFRILVATRIGERGIEQINLHIEQRLALQNPQISPQHHYQGRPIMVTENSYDAQLFNGDVGLIWPDKQGQLRAWFEQAEGEPRSLSLARLPAVESVYAMTIHKSQGSEFTEVAMLLPEKGCEVLSRELLYTGLTRAKQHLYILSNEQVWRQALTKKQQRWSGLADKTFGKR